MKNFLKTLTVIVLISMAGCEQKPVVTFVIANTPIDNFSATQLQFTKIEYSLYIRDKALACTHAKDLSSKIRSMNKIFCLEEIEEVHMLITNIERYAIKVAIENVDRSLDQLRTLKGRFMMIQTVNDHNTYLYNIWRFEEEMYYTTKAAIDPMLGLYEWGEFEQMVECMNEDWQIVQLHHPSSALFENNGLAYKIQTMARIDLQKFITRFNQATKSDDYKTNGICEHAMALRESYIAYIKTFVDQIEEQKPFLSTMTKDSVR